MKRLAPNILCELCIAMLGSFRSLRNFRTVFHLDAALNKRGHPHHEEREGHEGFGYF
jgi:hypothetical protein